MGPFEMVVAIVAIAAIGKFLSNRYGRSSKGESVGGEGLSLDEAGRLKAEVSRLSQRVETLERLATDPRKRLADEIDALGPR